MKILKRGVGNGDKIYRRTCRECKSRLEFKQKEMTYHADDRDGDWFSIVCPVCKENIIIGA